LGMGFCIDHVTKEFTQFAIDVNAITVAIVQ